MVANKIKGVFKKPHQKAEAIEVENTLEALQELIGGYIEMITAEHYVVIVDEEGRLKGLEPNFEMRLVGTIVGNALFVGTDDDEFASLDDNMINIIIATLNDDFKRR